MIGTILIGTSGMNAYSTALRSISNNVSNMNTPGFKAGSGSFANLVGGNAAGSGAAGQGVQFNTGPLNFAQGDLNTSTQALDLAVDGRGLLVLTDKSGARLYLRTGQFELKDGAIVQRGTGHQLQLRLPGGGIGNASVLGRETSAPQASSTVRFTGNLSVDSLATDHTVSGVTVYDKLGAAHTLSVVFAAATTQANGRNVKAVSVKDAQGVEVGSGKVEFSLTGIADSGSASFTVKVTATGGEETEVKLDFGALTGFSSGATSSVAAQPADGHALGKLTGVSVTEAGHLQAAYSNGQTTDLGAVLLADFDNLQSLQALDDGGFRPAVGTEPVLAVSGQDGLGRVLGERQEASNVDLTAEFGELILVQRGYQASSQIVSAANEMLGQLFELRGQR